MKNLFLVFILFSILNCNKEKSNEDVKLKNVLSKKLTTDYIPYADDKFDFNNRTLKEDLNKAIYENDTLAYNRACKKYATNGKYKEFLYYAILMAEKNNYRDAYWDISNILSFEDGHPLSNKFKSKYSIYSILKAYELGQRGARSSINATYVDKGQLVPLSTSIYCTK